MRRALIAAALLAVVTPAFAAGKSEVAKKHPAKDDAPKNNAVALSLDEVNTLTFKTPVATVYVGNPSIADVTMIDARHAFVQGKGYGRTNIMALNHDNVMVFNTHITVTGGAGGGTVTLNRGSQRVTLNCIGGRCEATPMPGDGKDAFETAGQAAAHQTVARGAALAEAKN
ncbi:MAG TPA: pilus assembly protein N-terminal domain-containing protein [Rhizomicrobium sp.]|nr:pilus assembly protein N-terminal domain-containing protein [Rhizomicrobium sp.]